MELFQLLDCNSSLGTCCSDYAIVGILNTTRSVFNVIQLVVPIILILAATIQFLQLTINPELKDGFRKILNKVIAAIIIFLLPMLVDVVLSASSTNFSIAECWQQSSIISNESVFGSSNFISTPDEKNAVWKDPMSLSMITNMGSEYMNKGGNRGGSARGSARGQEIVNYASQFIGEAYEYGGYWDGEIPYTPTDCSGFVTGVFRHFGIELPRGLNMFGYDTSLYDEVSESEMQAGDVIMYDGHVGIYTGVGKEIIHAANTNLGVIKSDDYSMCSSHGILGFLRIKGV